MDPSTTSPVQRAHPAPLDHVLQEDPAVRCPASPQTNTQWLRADADHVDPVDPDADLADPADLGDQDAVLADPVDPADPSDQAVVHADRVDPADLALVASVLADHADL